MELVNETFTLIYTYHLYLLTDYMKDIAVRSIVGKLLIFFAVLNIGINLCVVAVLTISHAARRIKLLYLKLQQKKRIQKRND